LWTRYVLLTSFVVHTGKNVQVYQARSAASSLALCTS
jgi:hypothetical protein